LIGVRGESVDIGAERSQGKYAGCDGACLGIEYFSEQFVHQPDSAQVTNQQAQMNTCSVIPKQPDKKGVQTIQSG